MLYKRFLYLAYYLKSQDWGSWNRYVNYVAGEKNVSKGRLWQDALAASLKYNISLMEYFLFRFYEKERAERNKWAGTGYMYEYQLLMNPPDQREILNDKTKFYRLYRSLMVHQVADVKELKENPSKAASLLKNPSGKLVFKTESGKCGARVTVHDTAEFDASALINYLDSSPFDLVEEFLIQHPDLNRLSPSGVNTVRIFTQLNKAGNPEILGCRLRISVNSPVDNLAAGNLAAPADQETGIVNGPGVYSDITKADETVHPVTGVAIEGFQIPFWNKVIDLSLNAALLYPQNRSVGWDIVVTEQGPGLIEGNHDWCKLLWQLPVKQGMKERLGEYL